MNVNTATAEQLEALPGVGTKLAQKVILLRPFEDLEDMVRSVPGMGIGRAQTLEPLLTGWKKKSKKKPTAAAAGKPPSSPKPTAPSAATTPKKQKKQEPAAYQSPSHGTVASLLSPGQKRSAASKATRRKIHKKSK